MTTGVVSLVLRNDSTTLMCIYVEPYPNDYWLQPGEALRLSGSPGDAEVEVTRFANESAEDGLTVWFGEDPDPTAETIEGISLATGHQRPA